ncbi:MAG TPA: PKD domain-containing protein, partial [Rubricoccaceae bacterium]
MSRLCSLAAAVLLAAPVAAQTYRTIDIPVEIQPYYNGYYSSDGNGFTCVTILEGFFPDVLGNGRYSDYRVSGPGFNFYGAGSMTTDPAGSIGFTSYPVGGGGGPAQSALAGCARARAYNLAAAAAVGPWVARARVPEGVYAYWSADDDRGLSVPFDGTASFAVTSAGRVPVSSYLWAFSDGGTSTAAAPTHRFDEPGTYTVSLRVTDAAGNADTHTGQVTVEGADLSYTVSSAPDSVHVGDDFQLFVDITNTGDVDLTDVRIGGTASITSLDIGMAVSTGPATSTGPFTLAPNGIVRVAYPLRATEAGRVELIAPHISGTHAGTTLTGRPACANGTCVETVRVIGNEMTVEVAYSNITGPVTAAPSGRSRFLNDVGEYITAQRTIRPGIGNVCVSGCVDVEVTVTDDEGEPVAGAEVRLGAPFVVGAGVVTPEQGGGFFCKTETQGGACARQLDAEPTDAEGRTRAVYWFPGLVQPAGATVTAVVTKPGFGQETGNAALQLLPTRVDFGYDQVALTPEDAEGLAVVESLRLLTDVGEVAVT